MQIKSCGMSGFSRVSTGLGSRSDHTMDFKNRACGLFNFVTSVDEWGQRKLLASVAAYFSNV